MRDYLFTVVSSLVVGFFIMTLLVLSVANSALGNNQRHFANDHSTCKHK